jgi:predicted signal transduction protein with EAL and GGDEF domain
VREVDTVARFGGDEFAIILKDILKAEDAAVVAQKVIASVARPFFVEHHELSVGTSVGIAIYPPDADDESELLRRADFAMFRAKEEGRDAFRFYSSEMNEKASLQMSLECELRRAIEGDELIVHYQPIIDVRKLKVTGCEALVRWQHPSRGLVLPGEFISLAEETGLIEPLGEIVLKKACLQARAWHTAGLPAMLMSINVSSCQIKKALTPEVVDRILNETGAASLPLAFEITESRTISESREAILWLHAVKELGIRLSIDDFGTGCSSLSYLKRFPVDIVKIDRSFTHDLTCDPDYAALVAGIIALARSMDIQVIAEGVEDAEQMAFLRLLKCDYVQGYHFARALQAQQFEQFARHFTYSAARQQGGNKAMTLLRPRPV